MGKQYKYSPVQKRFIRVYFYTSNAEKLAQAIYVFEKCGQRVHHFSINREPYEEDYKYPTQRLLEKAVNQIQREYSVKSLFFIEDTSLRIEALSKDKKDFPGLKVKEWFKETSFEELDRQLKHFKDNRNATVKSDIALHIPGYSNPILFHGQTSGVVALTPPSFSPNPIYQWLTPLTFNGWFIPDGTKKRLGEMEVEESLDYDFRAKALFKVCERVAEFNSISNLSNSHIAVRRRAQKLDLELPLEDRKILLFIGNTCAGKTTAGDILKIDKNVKVRVIEASSILRNQASTEGIEINSAEDAKDYLKNKGYDLVAKAIVKRISSSSGTFFVVTGLRTIEEILYLDKHLPTFYIINLETDIRTRFLRHISRGREKEVETFKEFGKKDSSQKEFGLLSVASEIADETILNEGATPETLGIYKAKIIKLKNTKINSPKREKLKTEKNQQHNYSELTRSLLALEKLKKASTCEEISEQSGLYGTKVKKYNTNRALKEVPDLAIRIEKKGDLLKYKITNRGKKFLSLLRLRRKLAE